MASRCRSGELSRRELGLLGAGLALASCESEEKMGFPLAPWQMWGTSETRTQNTGTLASVGQTQQLARVNYKRPESWNFFFRIAVKSFGTAAIDWDLTFNFDLILGVGRSSVILPEFETYRFVNPGAALPSLPIVAYSTQVNSPNRFQSTSNPAINANPGLIDYFVAEDIQCQLTTRFLDSGGGNPVTYEATAYFAPRVHVRPEWWSEGEQFRGKETGGT